jgi:predicted nucleic acid-binding protein
MTTATTLSGSRRIVVDSSGWLEYLTDDVNADRFAPYVVGNFHVIVPTIVVYEVYKKLLMESGKSAADAFASDAMRRTVVPLDDVLAISAAQISLDHHLPMADAIIYASTMAQNAELITGDPHFGGLPGVMIP